MLFLFKKNLHAIRTNVVCVQVFIIYSLYVKKDLEKLFEQERKRNKRVNLKSQE